MCKSHEAIRSIFSIPHGCDLDELFSGIALIICILSKRGPTNKTCVRKYRSFQSTNLQGYSIGMVLSCDRVDSLLNPLLCSNFELIMSSVETDS